MNRLKSIVTNHPVIFVLSSMIVWFVLVVVLTGIASSTLRKPYGDAVTATIGRLVTTTCILLFVWRMGWLDSSGIARIGRWEVWLIALGGLIYFASTSLYSFYGKVAFNFSNLIRSSESFTTVLTHFAAGLSEEILFRGVVLYSLIRVWGDTKKGIIGSVVLSSFLFAVMHLTNIFSYGVSPSSALLLTVETCIIAIWWGALVLWGKSIWPAVMLHFAVNAIVALQGLTISIVEPNILAYRRVLWFSILLGVIGFGLLVRAAPRRIVPEVP